MNCADKSARKTEIAQGKRRSSVNNYLKLNPNTRQRKESKKNAKTAKQQSRKQSKKIRNENNNTVCDRKKDVNDKKTQGNLQTLK